MHYVASDGGSNCELFSESGVSNVVTSEFRELDDIITNNANDDNLNNSDTEDDVLSKMTEEKVSSRYEFLYAVAVLQKYIRAMNLVIIRKYYKMSVLLKIL